MTTKRLLTAVLAGVAIAAAAAIRADTAPAVGVGGAGVLADEQRGQAHEARGLPRQVGRPLLLSQGLHERLHARGAELPEGHQEIRGRERRHPRRLGGHGRVAQGLLREGRPDLQAALGSRREGLGGLRLDHGVRGQEALRPEHLPHRPAGEDREGVHGRQGRRSTARKSSPPSPSCRRSRRRAPGPLDAQVVAAGLRVAHVDVVDVVASEEPLERRLDAAVRDALLGPLDAAPARTPRASGRARGGPPETRRTRDSGRTPTRG